MKNRDYDPNKLLTETEVAEIRNQAVQTLRNDRSKGRGLPYIKFKRLVRYKSKDVYDDIENRRVVPEKRP